MMSVEKKIAKQLVLLGYPVGMRRLERPTPTSRT